MAIEKPIESSAEAVRSALAPLRNDFSVAVLFTRQCRSRLAPIIRVAHSYLAREIMIVGAGTWYEKASMGMHKYETIVRVADADALLGGWRAPALGGREGSRASLTRLVVRFPPGVVFAFGSERFGLAGGAPRESGRNRRDSALWGQSFASGDGRGGHRDARVGSPQVLERRRDLGIAISATKRRNQIRSRPTAFRHDGGGRSGPEPRPR